VNNSALLALLQLTSPALPVGAYSYSEGLEVLVDRQLITNGEELQSWLSESLAIGSICVEIGVLVRVYRCWRVGDFPGIVYWNDRLSAMRESYELQQQNWQMGRSLLKLLRDIQPQLISIELEAAIGKNWNFAIVFAIAAIGNQIDERTAAIGYLYSWASNLVSAGVKLIPLGQTAGQKIMMDLANSILQRRGFANELTVDRMLNVPDDELFCCSWGLALASMNHETQYSRLFRS
jgi:urease accessory protein